MRVRVTRCVALLLLIRVRVRVTASFAMFLLVAMRVRVSSRPALLGLVTVRMRMARGAAALFRRGGHAGGLAHAHCRRRGGHNRSSLLRFDGRVRVCVSMRVSVLVVIVRVCVRVAGGAALLRRCVVIVVRVRMTRAVSVLSMIVRMRMAMQVLDRHRVLGAVHTESGSGHGLHQPRRCGLSCGNGRHGMRVRVHGVRNEVQEGICRQMKKRWQR